LPVPEIFLQSKPMKKIIALVVAVFAGVILGKIIFTNRAAAPPAAPIAESAPAQPAPPEKFSTPQPEPLPVSASAVEAPKVPAATLVVSEAKPDDSANPVHKAVDALLSAKSAREKHDLFQQLIKDGQIDAAIAELKQRAADNPNNAQLPSRKRAAT
jgi:type IV secretory pathway VirB10-like protein